MLRKAFFGSILFFSSTLSTLFAANAGIEGTYRGNMAIKDGKRNLTIPLALSVTFSNEVISTPKGEQKVIDASMIIDDEGGPYIFRKVTFNLEDNYIDFRYSRQQGDIETAPANFRLSGSFKEGGKIVGRVLSGTRGNIGTFEVTKTPEVEVLEPVVKYTGTYYGTAYMEDGSSSVPVTVTLASQNNITINPSGMEFDYSPSRFGTYIFRYTEAASFNHITMDYLRRRIIFSESNNGQPTVSLDMEIDLETGTMRGYHNSTYRGRTAYIVLKKETN